MGRGCNPRVYDKMLLPGVPVPPTVRYKRDFEQVTAAAAASAAAPAPSGPAEPPITDGPAVIHVEIRYSGTLSPPSSSSAAGKRSSARSKRPAQAKSPAQTAEAA